MSEETKIHTHLNDIFSQLSVPVGKGYYIGDGNEPVYIVYLPYSDDVTGRAEDKIAQVTYRVKVDIIARNGASFTKVENEVRELLEKNNFDYRNGESDVETEEPYNYHRTLYYNKNYFFNNFNEEDK